MVEKLGGKEDEALEDEALERQESDRRAKEKKRLKKKWSIEVWDCFFHLRGLQGHWRDNHVDTHTHSLELIQVLIFSLKDIPSLGMGWKFIYCFSTWTTSFSPLALFPTVDKREIATKPITHLSSLQPVRSCWMPPSFRLCHLFSDCVCVCACASSCLLNIIGISAGGLIKKQLPLVAVGDAWRRVARLIWWTVWGTLSVQHTHKHAHKLRSCLQN